MEDLKQGGYEMTYSELREITKELDPDASVANNLSGTPLKLFVRNLGRLYMAETMSDETYQSWLGRGEDQGGGAGVSLLLALGQEGRGSGWFGTLYLRNLHVWYNHWEDEPGKQFAYGRFDLVRPSEERARVFVFAAPRVYVRRYAACHKVHWHNAMIKLDQPWDKPYEHIRTDVDRSVGSA